MDENLIIKYVDINNQLNAALTEFTNLKNFSDNKELIESLSQLAKSLELKYREVQTLYKITSLINTGLLLDEVLEKIYLEFNKYIPYNRIGFALIEQNGTILKARWAKTDQPEVHIYVGYSEDLAGSSLEKILQTGKARIINDLEKYFEQKPSSKSTELALKEGIKASLTCPLIVNDTPIGFIFFSSTEKYIYNHAHIDLFQNIAQQLSIIVDKGRLITEILNQKIEIEKKNEELLKLSEIKNSFIGMATHDLRNPLGNIRMISELLLNYKEQLSPEERDKFIKNITNQSNYMLSLIEDLLEVSHIESGKFSINREYIQIHFFLSELLYRHDKLAEQKGTKVLLESDVQGTIYADPVRLGQIFDNLISNAVKYSPLNSIVRVKAEKNKGIWKFEIIDQGPGIKEDEKDRLFKDFSKLSARPTGGESSTGLGLAITKRVVEAHNGEIGYKPNFTRGTTFWFTIPDEF